jgi:L-iditol 2-dehydrogenase
MLRQAADVLLRIAAVGVCGSDVHYYKTGRIGRQVVEFPFVVGHECSAVVEDVGRGVTYVRPGDRVYVDPAVSCGTCDQCLAARHHTCRQMQFLGCPGQLPGCLSEYVVMPEECCYPIQDDLPLETAALAEPLSVGWYAVHRSIPMRGARVAVLGAGPIGLCVLLCAIEAGAEKVAVTDVLDYRLQVAKKRGAAWIGNPRETDIVKGILEGEPLQLDAVFDCCGEQEALDQAVELLKPGGKLMLVGIPEVQRVSFDIDLLRRKEIDIQNVRRQNGGVQPALDLIEKSRMPIGFLITHRFSLEQTRDAFELVSHYEDGVVKAMIVM